MMAEGATAIAWRAASLPGLESWERVEFVTEGVEGARADPRTWPPQQIRDFYKAIERWQGEHPSARVRAITFASSLAAGAKVPQLIMLLHFATSKG